VVAVRKIVVGVECYGSAAQTLDQKQQVLAGAMKMFSIETFHRRRLALVDEFRKTLGVENG
jgi:hypothetical protein